ncbi:MAG TPA: FtsX-like permease family protein [Candidatus Dormibacteraeota bacterium]|nr:FtsX-like permease family protein [Candidatus Dormibacteraeota bacterium]
MTAAWLLRALVLGYVREHPWRTLLTVVAVALGVGVAVAVQLANATAIRSFQRSVNVVSSRVNLQVVADGAPFDERALLTVQSTPGVTYAQPTVTGTIAAGENPGDPRSGEPLPVIGVDVLRPYPGSGAAQEREESGTAREAPELATLIGHDGVVVSREIAQRYHLRPGSRWTVGIGVRRQALIVAAIRPALVGVDASVVFADISTAQQIFGKVGRLDRIDCVVDPASALPRVSAELRKVLPPNARVTTPRGRTGEISSLLQSFRLNLTALAYVALLVGTYLIYNAVAIAVVQRRGEIGVLRALGVSRRSIFVTFVGEGFVVGLLGAACGLLFGALLARYTVAAVTQTVSSLYVFERGDRVFYDWHVFAAVFAIGVAAATLSTIPPALEAASTAPATTMRAGAFERRSSRRLRAYAGAGAAALAAGAALTRLPAIGGVPVAGFAAGLLFVFGVSLVAPLGLGGLARIGGALLGRFPAAALGARNVGVSLRRNGVALAALAVAFGMSVAIGTLVSSFRSTVAAWTYQTLKADLFITPAGPTDAGFDAVAGSRLPALVTRVPGVAAVDVFRGTEIHFRGRITNLGATNFSSLATRSKMEFLGRVDLAALQRELVGHDAVVASRPFVVRFGVRPGEEIALATPSGERSFRVVAVYNDYSSDAGFVVMDIGTYRRWWHDGAINSIAVYARPGVDLDALRARIEHAAAPARLAIQSNRQLRAQVLRIFDRTFAITSALYVISIAIAMLGVTTALAALVLERRREIGLLRYLGLRRAEVRTMVLVEAGLLGVGAAVAGVVLGMALGLLLIYVINAQTFGWLIELRVPWASFAQLAAAVVAAALAAAVVPANVAARIATAEAVREE